jgi:translation initiation factor 4A
MEYTRQPYNAGNDDGWDENYDGKSKIELEKTSAGLETKDSDSPSENNILNEWDDSNLKPEVLRGVHAYGFDKPSPIQKQGIIPMIARDAEGNGRDIIAQAQSGTGKTGCFVVSALNIVDLSVKQTQILILVPTHELAKQIKEVLDAIGKSMKGLATQLLIGGTPVEKDRRNLEDNTPHIVVGTPGRTHDLIRRKFLLTKYIKTIVLDEADEMLSQGFKDQIYNVLQYMPGEVQIGLFSATMPSELDELTMKFMKNPTKLLVKAALLTLQGIAQYFVNLDGDEHKYSCLKDLFATLNMNQTIVYCNSTRRVDDLYEAMVIDKFPVSKIHGKMDEREREESNKAFRDGACRVLIASDVYSRGVDIQRVNVVINFDTPKNEHTYLHRIGRSGRWGRKGIAINFATRHDGSRLKEFSVYYNSQIDELPENWAKDINM